ncbi:hypothetical protein KIN20_008940 [Parelaphostrongylus tenuis]|uniref:Uncharacterized protein n=1 Tax=Parelaphostrongylus tenuis TaxID=148309 RepID=A0AAD5QJA0_PARTN|nr:hypothetical protein KIN20_008940 [Parelaphostrongylus tenuis]
MASCRCVERSSTISPEALEVCEVSDSSEASEAFKIPIVSTAQLSSVVVVCFDHGDLSKAHSVNSNLLPFAHVGG